MKILFCQFHNNLINDTSKKDISDIYYTGIYDYKEKDGYYKTSQFFELPLWIAEICGSIKNSNIKKELYIIQNIKDAIDYINYTDANYICFSVLDVNKSFVKDIISNYKNAGLFILGGYINFDYFKGLKNYKILDTIKSFIEFLGIKYIYNLDYSLFKGYKTVPRLTLSTGCKNKCKFCTVEKIIVKKSKRDIIKQIEAFKDIQFKLVYLNDKTFGQASNYNLLPLIYKRIKKYNPLFKGFIIQTTCNQLLKKDFIENIKNSHIFACEIGVETYNNTILKELKKPQNINTINKAFEVLKVLKIKIIVNLIIGLINENKKSYNNTLNFINANKKDIYLLNIYNLAIYLNTELSKDITINNDNDLNENKTDKSFYNNIDLINNKYFYDKIFKIGIEILKN